MIAQTKHVLGEMMSIYKKQTCNMVRVNKVTQNEALRYLSGKVKGLIILGWDGLNIIIQKTTGDYHNETTGEHFTLGSPPPAAHSIPNYKRARKVWLKYLVQSHAINTDVKMRNRSPLSVSQCETRQPKWHWKCSTDYKPGVAWR